MGIFEITGQLHLEDINDNLHKKRKLALSEEAKKKIVAGRTFLDAKIGEGDGTIYGINTGFGSLQNKKISNDQLEKLQENLLISHACGTGEIVPQKIVKIMLMLKIQSLAYGNSAVQLETVERLIDFYNLKIIPVVYQQGSLGASGDLVPLAHLALPLIGRGEVWAMENDNWVKKEAGEVLKQHNIQPLKLKSKEGLALINGTQFMIAYGVHCLLQAQRLSYFADMISSISVDAFDCRTDPFHPAMHIIRPHKGQVHTAQEILSRLQDSEIAAQPKQQVQDPYSFRCIPQVHGATKDVINYTAKVFSTEIMSVTDNPNVFPEINMIISGGNFHGQILALWLDFLAIACAELGNISERRVYQLISGQRNLPEFLVSNPGLNSGLMIPQYVAASLVSQNKQFCTPASVDSIPSSNGQEDHVSMGANAATKCALVLNNLEKILAIELLNATQALAFRRPLKTAPNLEAFVAEYRTVVPFIDEDRELYKDIENSVTFLKNYPVFIEH
ncbi:MAG: histidine ammonia-lyase [Bacteroidia bacterium]